MTPTDYAIQFLKETGWETDRTVNGETNALAHFYAVGKVNAWTGHVRVLRIRDNTVIKSTLPTKPTVTPGDDYGRAVESEGRLGVPPQSRPAVPPAERGGANDSYRLQVCRFVDSYFPQDKYGESFRWNVHAAIDAIKLATPARPVGEDEGSERPFLCGSCPLAKTVSTPTVQELAEKCAREIIKTINSPDDLDRFHPYPQVVKTAAAIIARTFAHQGEDKK